MRAGQLSIISALLAAGCQTADSSPIARDSAAATYQTSKTLPVLEKCLTDNLSQLGEVTSIHTAGETTLMLGKRDRPSMLIDLAPPRVAVTTDFAVGTRSLVEECL